MPPSFPWYEQWATPENGFPILLKYAGEGSIDGSDCHCYEEYQWVPGKMRHLIASINAPYCKV